jgi:hypothetical protein
MDVRILFKYIYIYIIRTLMCEGLNGVVNF